MGFFADNAQYLAPLALGGPVAYRDCQVGAAWATLAHFTASSEPALISMPTGSGKTALMMMLAFLLQPERVIIVTPSVILRGQTSEKFSSLSDLISIGAYPPDGKTPSVHNHEGQVTSQAQWSDLLKTDVVIVTPHTTSPGYETIVGPEIGLIGPETVVFFDEAHHSRARTWHALMDAFSGSRMILLTATPFRNDNRRLLAKLVYHYPMKNALDAGIYAKIKYHAVEVDDVNTKDVELCRKARLIYRRNLRENPQARLLIRAEGVKASAGLLALYQEMGLKVAEVNYKQTLQANSLALEAIKNGTIDGVVCIDQIGEGLDIPNLKIAVLHKPRQSFPATVQFIGRISREATAGVGEPHLIACPDDVRGPLQRLYLHDNSWRDFLPELVQRIVGRALRRSAFHSVVDVETELDLSIEDIEPFFSVRVYQSDSNTHLKSDTDLDLRDDIFPVFFHEIPDKNMLVIITALEKTLPWAEKADLVAPRFDLHVFYLHEKSRFLFEYTTSDKIAGLIRKSFWADGLKRLDAANVANAMKIPSRSKYLMFGLSNLSIDSRFVPSYKTYMGTEVEGAIRLTDARTFTPGHALAKYESGETRGVGSFQSRVWAIKRAPLADFKDWCDAVSDCLEIKGDGRLPNVEFLPSPESISLFPAKPLAIYARWNPDVSVALRIGGANKQIGNIVFENLALIPDRTAIKGLMKIDYGDAVEETKFIYTLSIPYWHFDRQDFPQLNIDDGETHLRDISDFLDHFPPVIILDDGNTVMNGCVFKRDEKVPRLPDECLDDERDWSNCDIHVEFPHIDKSDPSKNRVPEPGKMTVQDQVESWLKAAAANRSLIVKDHTSGELADFIEVDVSSKVLSFYHCKACASGKSAGARIDELKALEQVLRSINYLGRNALVELIHSRVIGSDRPNTVMVKGTADALGELSSTFHANEWAYEVFLVNPGIDSTMAMREQNTRALLGTCYEWLAAAGVSFRLVSQ